GCPTINGGTYVIYEHASRLKKRGHQVILVTRQEVVPEKYAWH
ncbi:MAG: glycosyl transferase family 1, partial [Candidatus Electrothrix sp. AW1]|nr:glycosyl transferase family 1 [Candidatus Electrothrix gigas]